MRKPFKAGRFTLEVADIKPWWWLGDAVGGEARYISDADLRHLNRLTAKALKYRHQGKRAK